MKLNRSDLLKIDEVIQKIKNMQNNEYEECNVDLIWFLRQAYCALESQIIYNETKERFGR